MIMERVLLKISYLGTAYHGWQVQPNGVTVQQVLQSCIEGMFKQKISLTGCSRTDAGVHANEFFCHFDTGNHIDETGIIRGLNSVLPHDIVVQDCKYVSSDFHSRYSAKGKNYVYKILNRPIGDPFLHDRVWHISRPLNAELMSEFCKTLCGTHDFIGFSSSGRTVTDTVRTVFDCDVQRNGDMVTLSVSADGFLYNMVRIIVGTAVDVSDGKYDIAELGDIISSCDRSAAGMTAPPQGLYLNRVFY